MHPKVFIVCDVHTRFHSLSDMLYVVFSSLARVPVIHLQTYTYILAAADFTPIPNGRYGHTQPSRDGFVVLQ